MKVVVIGLISSRFESVMTEGVRHPVLGLFLDAGTYGAVDVAPGKIGMDLLLNRWSGEYGATMPTLVDAKTSRALESAADLSSEWNDVLSAGNALCLVVVDGAAVRHPVFILNAYGAPSMGPIAMCAEDDLLATWVRLGGGTPTRGRFLLEEVDSAFDGAAEDRLTDRLRQLYGE